jgi:hypothetical protein
MSATRGRSEATFHVTHLSKHQSGVLLVAVGSFGPDVWRGRRTEDTAAVALAVDTAAFLDLAHIGARVRVTIEPLEDA